MKLLERIYNWLSDNDPYAKFREHRARKLFLNSNPEFLLWAFGEHYEDKDIQARMNYWNLTHGDKLFIDQVDHFGDRITQMGMLWTDYVAKETKV
jgi:hypothetical protein